jgi:hypothetical protein
MAMVTIDETWVSFANVGTKQQSKEWMYPYSQKQKKKTKKIK